MGQRWLLLVGIVVVTFVTTVETSAWVGARLRKPISRSSVPVLNLDDLCPTNYIYVPALAGYTTEDFCVAKYEMKSSGAIVSAPAGTPLEIPQSSADTICAMAGSRYNLISNAQWQTIARNIETVDTNWSGGTAGSGALNRGHSDGSPAISIAASADDDNACSGTGQTCSSTVWNNQRRTHTLTTGSVIWDFAGNSWEWVIEEYSALGVSPAISTTAGQELSSLSANNRALFSSANATWNSAQGLGKIQGGSAGVLRGGASDSGTSSGIFAAVLNQYMGALRCVYKP